MEVSHMDVPLIELTELTFEVGRLHDALPPHIEPYLKWTIIMLMNRYEDVLNERISNETEVQHGVCSTESTDSSRAIIRYGSTQVVLPWRNEAVNVYTAEIRVRCTATNAYTQGIHSSMNTVISPISSIVSDYSVGNYCIKIYNVKLENTEQLLFENGSSPDRNPVIMSSFPRFAEGTLSALYISTLGLETGRVYITRS